MNVLHNYIVVSIIHVFVSINFCGFHKNQFQGYVKSLPMILMTQNVSKYCTSMNIIVIDLLDKEIHEKWYSMNIVNIDETTVNRFQIFFLIKFFFTDTLI